LKNNLTLYLSFP